MIAKRITEKWSQIRSLLCSDPPVSPSHSEGSTGPAQSAPFPPPAQPSASTLSLCSATLASSMFIKHARCVLTSGPWQVWRLRVRKLFPQTPALLAPSSPHIVDEVTLIILSKLHNRPPNTPPSASLMFSPEQFVLSNIFHTLLLSLLSDFPPKLRM